MKKGRDGLHDNGDAEAVHAFGEEGTDAGALVDRKMRVRKKEVLARPAVLERCQQSAKEGYDEAQEPEHVHQDGRGWWFEAGLKKGSLDRGMGAVL